MIDEEKVLAGWLADIHALRGRSEVLDYGCGRGRMAVVAVRAGHHVVGVDASPHMRAESARAGLQSLSPDEFTASSSTHDIIILSHIIEHFAPGDLHRFLVGLFDRMKPNGYVIVATPLLSPWFHDDFDHVRPYHPKGLLMAFSGGRSEQLQYASPYRLELEDIRFRRAPFQISFARRLYTSRGLRWPRPANRLLRAAFLLSGHLIGRTDGWMGLFRLRRDPP